MIIVNLAVSMKTHVVDIIDISSDLGDDVVGTTNDVQETKLVLKIEGDASQYGVWCDFGVMVPNKDKTKYSHPSLKFNDDNTLIIPYAMMHYAVTGILPIQITFRSKDTVFSTVNSVRLKVAQAIDGELDVDIPSYVNVLKAVDDFRYNDKDVTVDVHRFSGDTEQKPLSGMFDDLSSKEYHIILAAGGWVNDEQAVSVEGADPRNSFFVSYEPWSYVDGALSEIVLTKVEANKMYFSRSYRDSNKNIALMVTEIRHSRRNGQ